MGSTKQIQLEEAERRTLAEDQQVEAWLERYRFEGWDAETYEAFMRALEKDD